MRDKVLKFAVGLLVILNAFLAFEKPAFADPRPDTRCTADCNGCPPYCGFGDGVTCENELDCY